MEAASQVLMICEASGECAAAKKTQQRNKGSSSGSSGKRRGKRKRRYNKKKANEKVGGPKATGIRVKPNQNERDDPVGALRLAPN